MAKLSINSIKPEICNYYAFWGFLVILYQFICINRLTPKRYFLQEDYLRDSGRSTPSYGLQRVQRLAARIIWRSGDQDMSVGRFRSDGGTHRVHFEQKISGEDLDRAIAFRRPKLAKIDI